MAAECHYCSVSLAGSQVLRVAVRSSLYTFFVSSLYTFFVVQNILEHIK